MRADRARGWTVRQLARRYGLGLQTTHRVVRHVPIQLPNPWHRARLPEDGPLPPLAVHRYLVRLPPHRYLWPGYRCGQFDPRARASECA